MGTDEPTQELWPSEKLVSDAIGRLIEFWGFKRHMGRMWAVLYLSDRPLTSVDLRELLKLSSGTVSTTLNGLQRWGVVKKVWIQGERKDHFVAEANLWKMVSRVLSERERVEILESIDAMERAIEFLQERARTGSQADKTRARAQIERIKRLLDLAKLGRRLLDALVEKARVDASPLVKFLLSAD